MADDKHAPREFTSIPRPLIGPIMRNREGGSRRWPMDVAIGIACAAIAGGLRYSMTPLLGDQAPLLPFVLAVIVACVLNGWIAGIIATLISGFFGICIIAPWPSNDHVYASVAHATFFLIVCGLIVSAIHALQQASRREQQLLAAANSSKRMLELERHRLSLALKAGGSGTFDWNTKQNTIAWSAEMLQLHGLSAAQFDRTYAAWLACIHPEDLNIVKHINEIALQTGSAQGDYRIVRRDTNEVRWLHSRCVVLYDEHKQPECCLGVNVDITEQKQAETALRLSEERLKLIYNNASDCLYLIRVSGDEYRFISANDTFMRVSGFDRERVEGRRMEEVVPAANHALVRAKYREVINTRQKLVYEEAADLPAGKRYGEVTLVPIADPFADDSLPNDRGEITMILGAIKDVTAMHEAEAALHDASKRKDEFLAMLAHELRNPLAPIHNIAHLFANSRLDPTLLGQYGAILLRQTRHMMRLVDDLLDVSRITRGTIVLKCEYTVLDSVIDGALETLKPQLESKQQSLSVTHSSQPIMIFGDPARLSQIFVNLIGNASKYSAANTKVSVKLELDAGFAVVSIADQGIGIDAASLPRVFELFMQAEQSLDRSHGGLGVGLTIVKRLVEMHGGQVEARSAGIGQGSEFIVRLPLTAATKQLS